MSTKLCLMAADFRTSLATELAVSGTSCTLQSITDDDGVTLPNGTYMFTLDLENSQKEHFVATLTGTALSAMSSISRQGVQTSGAVRKHRIGASVTMTDFAHIMYMNNLLKGVTDLNASVPLKYDGVATLTPGSNEICTVAYADALTFAGAPNASTTQKGIIEIATAAEMASATGTGGTGALLVPPNSQLKKTSAGAADENKIPVLDASGLLATGFIPVTAIIPSILPAGMVVPFAGTTVPTGWLLCDGSAVSRATYATLYTALNPTQGTFTVTIASPGVVTKVAHGLATGDSVFFTTTGALPTGLAVNTRYWIIKVNADTFQLATSLANALAGTNINTSGSQSGVHTFFLCPYGLGDGSTTFNVPSVKSNVLVGKDQTATEFAGLGQTGGAKTHTLTSTEMPTHTHQQNAYAAVSGSGAAHVLFTDANTGSAQNTSDDTDSAGSDGAHNNLQPYLVLNHLVKT